jgi:hypothetical protein
VPKRLTTTHMAYAVLVAALAAQLFFLVRARIAGATIPYYYVHGIGDRLPDAEAGLVELHGERYRPLSAHVQSARCSLIVLADTRCGVCARARRWWASSFRSWRDHVGTHTDIQAFWLLFEDPGIVRSFVSGHDLTGVGILTLRDATEHNRRRFGAVATPLYILVTDDMYIADMSVIDLPAITAARSTCGAYKRGPTVSGRWQQ